MRSGIDPELLEPAVRPQDDLFRHVNGMWLDRTEIPQDRAVYGTFHLLRDQSEERLLALVEELSAGSPEPGSEAAKVGDLYASFMDEDTVERLGAGPIADDLAAIAAVGDLAGLTSLLGRLHRHGVSGAFGVWVNADAKRSDRHVLYATQGGLGLPDESYYREDSFAATRESYVAHVERMLDLAGIGDAAARAGRIMALETRLAASHWDRVQSRDATRTYTKVDRAGLDELTPGFDWSAWIAAFDAPQSAFDAVVVRQPSYLTGFAAALPEVPLEDWKAWLSWRVVHSAAPFLSSAFVKENFDFYGRTLTGAPELRERWKRGVGTVEGALGEAVGKLYVQRWFPPAARERMVELVANLVEAYRRSIAGLDWMSAETRDRALAKLERFTPKIGYPDEWRDYSALEIRADDLAGNVRRATEVEWARDLAKLDEPVDRLEWFMTPQTVNAYYNPLMNEIVFPAAILQPPFFDPEVDDATNYGAIGAVIGHEIGHGFDDQGSKYDGAGNLNDWWTDADRVEFERRTRVLIEQYDALEPRQAPGHHVNGALTVGENIGDLGGLSIAYAAYRIALEDSGTEEPGVLDGLTGDQRFFVSWAQAWRNKARDAEVIRRLALDPHSPDEFRCNAVVRNIDAFHAAFGVAEGDGLWLAPAERVRIW